MMYRLFVFLTPVLLLSSCSLYLLGHSKNGDYFGGQGNARAPRIFVPKDVQRQEPAWSVDVNQYGSGSIKLNDSSSDY